MKKQSRVTENKKIKTMWNLKLLYKSPNDPQIEKDILAIEKICKKFSDTWKSQDSYINNQPVLLKALQEYKKVMEIVGDAKPVAYFMLARDIDTTNTRLSAKISQIQERITRATNQVLFFEINLGHSSEKTRSSIRKNKDFQNYHYFLEKIWKAAKHRLSDNEEKIMSLKSEPAYELWVSATQKLVSEQQILWKGKLVPIHQAIGMVASLPASLRKKLHGRIVEKLKSISFFAATELNAVCINKKIDDSLRSFSKPYSATISDYENDEQAIESMMDLLKNNQKYSHRFYALKAQLLNVPKLSYADIGVNLSTQKQVISFEQAADIVARALGKIHPRFREIFESYLENGQIDVYPRVGKRGGGYCWGGYNRPTYILLNWSNDFHSVMTLAHEIGHAIHRELSKSQSVFYESHPISTAEVASTLFENFIFQELILEMNEREVVFAQFNRCQDAVATVFRQGAYFEFERIIHERIRSEGQISANDFAMIMSQELRNHLGKSVEVHPDGGYLFVRHAHARWFFYVYSYAYGKLISNVLYKKYTEDASFIEKIHQFLSAGGSQSPEMIFKSIGLDTSKESFWREGIDAIGKGVEDISKSFKKRK